MACKFMISLVFLDGGGREMRHRGGEKCVTSTLWGGEKCVTAPMITKGVILASLFGRVFPSPLGYELHVLFLFLGEFIREPQRAVLKLSLLDVHKSSL